MRKLPAAISAAFVVALVVGIAPPAQASEPVAESRTVPTDSWIDPNLYGSPSTTKWRAFMLNITSKMLGDSMPTPWAREQAANLWSQSPYNVANSPDGRIPASWMAPSGEQMNAQYSQANLVRNANGDLVPSSPRGSGTYDDYVLDNYERELNGQKPRNGITAPATKGANFVKGVAGATSAFLAFDLANMLGGAGVNAVGGWLGFDAQGAVCSQTSAMRDGSAGQDVAADMLNFISGQDCPAWNLADSYVPNADAGTGLTELVVGSARVKYESRKINPTADYDQYCYTITTATVSAPSGHHFAFRTKRGDLSSMGNTLTRRTVGGSFNCAIGFVQHTAWKEGSTTLTLGGAPGIYLVTTATGAVAGEMKQIAADPDRTQTCTVKFTDGTSASSTGDPYKESSGKVSPPQCPPTPDGKVPESIVVTEDGSGTQKTLYEQPTTEAFKDWVQNTPECGTGACLLDLLVKQPNNTYASCFDLEAGCVGWNDDPNKTDKYACRYGVKERPLAECLVYAGLFNPGRVEVGAPYSDPLTGVWSGGN
ncbi:MAG: hypothetical protein K0R62_8387, partial [Nonomuraea muscovyensis]|nr:hypothetical protein [Nonomuraea muscovyensis]